MFSVDDSSPQTVIYTEHYSMEGQGVVNPGVHLALVVRYLPKVVILSIFFLIEKCNLIFPIGFIIYSLGYKITHWDNIPNLGLE